jgi:phosphate starvation-inducible protein PhoH
VRGLLSNDQEWYNAFDEAASWATSGQLRQLFITMLLFCEVSDELKFFENVWRLLADDIQYNVHQTLNHQTYQISNTDLRDEVLERLHTLFNKRGRRIDDFYLPRKSVNSSRDSVNRLFDEELNYNASDLLTQSEDLIAQLNSEQRHAFDSIVNTVLPNNPGLFFVTGYVGTGKTFLWNTIITYLRGHKKFVLPVASSGVASLLLPGGRMMHS